MLATIYALRTRWPEYPMEAAGLGLFMVWAACAQAWQSQEHIRR